MPGGRVYGRVGGRGFLIIGRLTGAAVTGILGGGGLTMAGFCRSCLSI